MECDAKGKLLWKLGLRLPSVLNSDKNFFSFIFSAGKEFNVKNE